VNNQKRSVVIYVWDNDEQKLVALYRAVRTEDLGQECAAGFNGYFVLEQLNEFLAGLYKAHSSHPVAIRDWLASSSEDFHTTRLGWTKQEFEHFGPRIPPGPSAPEPVLKIGEIEWEMKGLEFLSNAVGMPAGLPKEKTRIITAMKNYFERARRDFLAELSEQGVDVNDESALTKAMGILKQRGVRTFDSAEDVPTDWFSISAPGRIAALQLFDAELDKRGDRFLEIVLPHRDRDLFEALQKNYANKLKIRLHVDPDEQRYYFQTIEKEGLIYEWWIGAHQDELVRAFGSLVG